MTASRKSFREEIMPVEERAGYAALLKVFLNKIHVYKD